MAKIRFVVESVDAASIWIRHVRTARLFCFAIVDRKLEGTLGGELERLRFQSSARSAINSDGRSPRARIDRLSQARHSLRKLIQIVSAIRL